jgi:flavin reductase (DIM6/NTAB) family NADH-FMN oxidoreductase RutF
VIENVDQLMKNISHGMYVISVNNNQQKNAFTAAWVMQVSFDPLLICFSINPQHRSYKLLKENSVCCISVLNTEQFREAGHFGQSTTADKIHGFNWLKTEVGAPALAGSSAYFVCRVDHYSDAGDHQLVICEVIDGKILSDKSVMLYSDTEDMDASSDLYKT